VPGAPSSAQQLQQLRITRLRRAHERRGAILEEPLHREDGARQRVVLDLFVRVGTLLEHQRDDVEVIHVRLGDRIVATFDVAVIGRQIERRPAALVGDVRIGALLEQELGELIVPVVHRGQQRRPAVLGDLVDRRACVEEELR